MYSGREWNESAFDAPSNLETLYRGMVKESGQVCLEVKAPEGKVRSGQMSRQSGPQTSQGVARQSDDTWRNEIIQDSDTSS